MHNESNTATPICRSLFSVSCCHFHLQISLNESNVFLYKFFCIVFILRHVKKRALQIVIQELNSGLWLATTEVDDLGVKMSVTYPLWRSFLLSCWQKSKPDLSGCPVERVRLRCLRLSQSWILTAFCFHVWPGGSLPHQNPTQSPNSSSFFCLSCGLKKFPNANTTIVFIALNKTNSQIRITRCNLKQPTCGSLRRSCLFGFGCFWRHIGFCNGLIVINSFGMAVLYSHLQFLDQDLSKCWSFGGADTIKCSCKNQWSPFQSLGRNIIHLSFRFGETFRPIQQRSKWTVHVFFSKFVSKAGKIVLQLANSSFTVIHPWQTESQVAPLPLRPETGEEIRLRYDDFWHNSYVETRRRIFSGLKGYFLT